VPYCIDGGVFNNLELWNNYYSVWAQQDDAHHNTGLSIDNAGSAPALQIIFVILPNWTQNFNFSLLQSPDKKTFLLLRSAIYIAARCLLTFASSCNKKGGRTGARARTGPAG
jgi:hypothetical protein